MVNRFFFVILFLLLISCASKVDVGIDLNSLKKEGSLFKQNENLYIFEEKIEKINSIVLPINENKDIDFTNLVNKKFFSPLKDNNFKKDIIYYNDKLIYVDDRAILHIVNTKLERNKKIRILNEKNIKNYSLKFSLLIDNDILYGADNYGSIFSLDLKNYNFLWHNFLNVPFYSNLVSYKNSIFALNSNGKIFSFRKSDGNVLWSQEIGSGIIKSHESFKIINIKDTLVFTNDLGFVYCLDLISKNSMWNFKIPLKNSKVSNDVLKLSKLIFDEKYIYFSSNLGGVFKIDLKTGGIVWSSNIFSNNPIFIIKKNIILLTTNGFMTILDKKSGEVMYNKDIKKIISTKYKSISNLEFLDFYSSKRNLYIYSNFGDLLIFDSFDLKLIKYKKISKFIASNIINTNKFVYFLAEEGKLYQYR